MFRNSDDPRLSIADFKALSGLVQSACGQEFALEMRMTIERKLRDRLLILGLDSFAEYFRLLRADPKARDELLTAIELISTHETYFFREEYQLRAFSEEVVPLLLPAAQPRQRLSIWSAGCSTGEEVYSIAAILQESKPVSNIPFRILGSDISKACLAHARRGFYGQSALRATSIERTQRWFDQANNGWTVKGALRAMCQFGHVNLLDGERIASVGTVDVIFCRNVLIYFNDRARRQVIDHFYDRLVPGGVLFLGHAESLLNVSTDFELLHLRRDLAYRKPLSSAGDPSVNLVGAGAVAEPSRGSAIRSRTLSDEPPRQIKRVSS